MQQSDATELQQSCNRAATELQQSRNRAATIGCNNNLMQRQIVEPLVNPLLNLMQQGRNRAATAAII
jgi:hypothetical protein